MVLKKLWPFGKKKKTRTNDVVKYSVPERVYTPVNLLAIGMYVIELDRPWLDSPFLFQGFEIKDETEIMQLKDCCDYVYIDTTKDRKRRPLKLEKDPPTLIDTNIDFGTPPPKLSRFDKEIGHAEVVHKQVGELVSDFMERIARGQGVDTKAAKAAVAECVNSILHSPDAFLWLNQLKNKDEYTAQHSLNVCVLSIVLGRHINFSMENLNNVGLCGMMHDMGKMLVPLHILNKPGRLEPDEMEIMRSHASLGYELLKSSQDMYRGAVDSAHSHHETLDGKGYPNKLNHKQLSLFTRVVTIADMYDAITSDRVYQKGRTHLEATSIMSDLSGTHLDGNLVVKFIEALGVYPPGCVVAMTNNCIAIVVEVNELVRLRPRIIILLDQDQQPVPEEVINLADMPLDDRGNLLTIRGIVKAQDYGIDIAKYYQQGILQKGFSHGKS